MDNPKTVDCLEWCYGYGGNHLGLKRVVPNLRCIAASEIEGYAVANMVSKMEAGLLDPFPVWSDCKTFPCSDFSGLVDLFIASYPCQPFSSAGKRNGADDPRHLWPYVRRAVEIIRPGLCFFENVEGHISLGLREVITELALLGYRVENSRGEPTWGVFSAAEAGAPQGRKRVFILAICEGVVLDDALLEQVERFNERRLSSGALRTGELANYELGTEQRKPLEKRAEELSGGVELANPFNGRSQNGRQSSSLEDRNEGHENYRSKAEKLCASDDMEYANSGIGNASRSESREAGAASLPVGASVAKSDKFNGRGRAAWKDRTEACDNGDGLAIASGQRQQGSKQQRSHEPGTSAHGATAECSGSWNWPGFVTRPGQQQHGWEPSRIIRVERGLGGGVNGCASNVDRLRLLGNGVYPATAAIAFATLYARLK